MRGSRSQQWLVRASSRRLGSHCDHQTQLRAADDVLRHLVWRRRCSPAAAVRTPAAHADCPIAVLRVSKRKHRLRFVVERHAQLAPHRWRRSVTACARSSNGIQPGSQLSASSPAPFAPCPATRGHTQCQVSVGSYPVPHYEVGSQRHSLPVQIKSTGSAASAATVLCHTRAAMPCHRLEEPQPTAQSVLRAYRELLFQLELRLCPRHLQRAPARVALWNEVPNRR